MAEALQITERRSLQLATVMARKGVEAAAVGGRLGLTAPVGPNTARADGLTLIGTGPGVWLAVAENVSADWAERLGQTLQGVASVSEQSGGYVVLRMTGAGAADLLQKGAFIDLHPQAFPVGSAAVTVIAHIGVILWKVDEAPSFDVAVFRSLAGSFHDWIAAAAPA
ncbi:MAG TPA: sarcosine oxidase subunit gamma family protein [Caulobacteraceae bacterium]|nr:sarcosine oxidase subunit gamma family protein [Caulobacteraceae bacterium]